MYEISYPNFTNDLRNIIEPECSKCADLVQKRKEISWGYGPLTSKIIFVAEAPATGDPKEKRWKGSNYTGIPFTNLNSGKFFRSQIKRMGFDLTNDFYVTNTVKCLPSKLNAKIKRNCCEHLKREIEVIQPELIVCVGGTALKEIFKLLKGKYCAPALGDVIKKGTVEVCDYNVVAMIHPAYFHVWLKEYGFKNEKEYIDQYRSILVRHKN